MKHKKIFWFGSGVCFILIAFIGLLIYSKFNDPDFYIEDIPETIKQHFEKSCDIEQLMLVNVKYYTLNDSIDKNGQFLIFRAIAPEVLELFKELYKIHFKFASISPVSEKSNNSIAYICNAKDLHKYGMAFSINPIQNPSLEFIEERGQLILKTVLPSKNFINRIITEDGMIETVVKIFYKHGFTDWGGNLKLNINWQYFALSNGIAEVIRSMNLEDAVEFFKIFLKNPKTSERFDYYEFRSEILLAYHTNSKKMLKILNSNIKNLNKMSDSEIFSLLHN